MTRNEKIWLAIGICIIIILLIILLIIHIPKMGGKEQLTFADFADFASLNMQKRQQSVNKRQQSIKKRRQNFIKKCTNPFLLDPLFGERLKECVNRSKQEIP